MRIFISYRRDDTAGRAGRLFDVLVNRFGSRNVFQDVAAIAPGADFTRQVADAIANSDAALVVIGSEWLTMRGPDGTRRLDEPDDYVRGEVSAALAAGVPVVPVLVGDAELPAPGELPPELRPLVNRQAARIRDDSWHQDVDALVRRLEGEEVVDTPPRRWPLVAGAAAVVAAVVIGWLWLGRDNDGDGDDTNSDEPGACTEPNESWTDIDVAEGTTAVRQTDGLSLAYSVRAAAYQVQSPNQSMIVLGVELANETERGEPVETPYFSYAEFKDLLVDGISVGEPDCFTPISADQNVEPGERAVGLLGFESFLEPADVPLVLEVEGDLDIEITPGG